MTHGVGERPRVLLNLAGLKVAGGRSVGINLIRAWDVLRPSFDLTVVGPEKVGYEGEVDGFAHWVPLVGWRTTGWARPWVDAVTLPAIVRELNPAIVLTLSNMACRIPAGMDTRQALQIMWPYAMYEDAEIWDRIPILERLRKQIRLKYLRWSSRRADQLIVQTEVAKRRLLERLSIQQATVIPTATTLPRGGRASHEAGMSERLTWLCVSRYYPHKNLEALVDVAQLLKDQGHPSEILLTIEPKHGPGARTILADIESRDLRSHIWSIGEVSLDSVGALYSGAFGVVFPTLLESYSQVFVETLASGLPLVTSDRDFAHAACGDAPVFVDPLSPSAIASAMLRLEADADFRKRKVQMGLRWASSQPTWHDIGRLYARLCLSMADR